MGMTKGAISKLADRLLGKGLVARASDPADKRAHSLSISPEGEAKVPVLAASADENDAAFFAVLSGDEQAQLRNLLTTLINKHGLSSVPVD